MSPGVRRALHEALDLVLDAVAQEGRDAAKPRRQRKKATPPNVCDIAPETLVKARRALARVA